MLRFQSMLVLSVFIVVQPQVEVKSFPAEPINPLASNSDGTYIVGGGASGDIYLWEVHTNFVNMVLQYEFY